MSFADHKRDIAYAAITRHMNDKLYTGDAESGFKSTTFIYGDEIYPVTAGDKGTVKLSQPGDNAGSYEIEFNPYQDIYKPWIDKIDQAFENWDPEFDICEPSDFTPLINQMHDAVFRLTLTPGDGKMGGGENIGNAPISTSIGYVGNWIQPGVPGAFDGAAVRAFDDMYGAARMRLVTGNQRELMIVLGLALGGERTLWTNVRNDLSTIVYGAKKAFADDGDAGAALKVLMSIIGLAGSFASGGVATAFGVLDAAGGVVESVLPPEDGEEIPAELKGSSADEVYENMVKMLDKLADGARETEEKLNTMLESAISLACRPSRRASFHIHPDHGLDPGFAGAGPIDIDADLSVFRDIGYREMPEIAAEMLRASNAASAARDLGPWIRNAAIGYGPFGPFYAWSDLHDVVTSITDSSAKEIVVAGEKLAEFAGYLEDTDGTSRTALKGLTDDLKDVPAEWKIKDSTPVPVPMPRHGGAQPI